MVRPCLVLHLLKNKIRMDEQQMTKKQRREQRKQEKAAAQARLQKQQTMKRLGMWGVVLVVLVGIVWAIASNQNTTHTSDEPGQTVLSASREGAHVKGNAEAAVSIVEYSDFQCPACAAYFPLIEQVLAEYGDRVSFEYRHFPLQQIHPNAEISAIAAEAAGVQGKFWEMHDVLFENQDDWSRLSSGAVKDRFVAYADELGLDTESFKQDLETNEIEDIVDADYQSGVTAGVTGTPSLYIQGQKIVNPGSYDEFATLIELALAEAASEQEATGIIEGLLTYPSEVLPELTICSENVVTQETHCTNENKIIVHEETPKYTGTGYQLEVPVGQYVVYAYQTDVEEASRAYYSEFVECGLDVQKCDSHEPIVVEVTAGEVVRAVHPADWYDQQ